MSSDIGIEWHTGCRFKGYIPDPVNPVKRKTFLYARMSFATIRLMESAAYRLRDGLFLHRGGHGKEKTAFVVYEDRIDADQKFVDCYNLQPSAWHTVPKAAAKRVSDRARMLLVNDEYAVENGNSFCVVEGLSAVPPMIIASVDAEMNGVKPDRFPKASRHTDAVVVVGVVFAFAGGESASEGVEFERQAFVLGSVCDPIAGVIVRLFSDERELIAAVRDELFVKKHVDVVAGHNLVKFDMNYLATRIQVLPHDHPATRFLRFGALVSEKLLLKEKCLTSAGMGANTLSLLIGVGFAYVDTMLLCKQNHKLRENTLSFAANTFLPGDSGKFDMPYSLIPLVAAGSNGAHWRLLTAYCVQDCLLVLQLLKKWDSVKDLVAQSRVINIPMAVNVLCGQQQRVRDSLMKKARTMNMVMNGVNEKRKVVEANVTAEGGWVLDNVPGLHDIPVVVLDFASLYPSVQREHNLCWSTVIDDIAAITDAHRAGGLVVKTYETATGTYHIASNVPGVFPLQLKDLLDARKQYKKDMGEAEYGTSAYQNADAKQKATKIVMNSGYGTANCEEGKGVMPCKAVGTITCAEGRKLNQRADAYCQQRFGTHTLYGDTDSIMVYFPEKELYARVLAEEGRAPTRKERLAYAMHMGETAERVLNDEVFCSDVIKTECEKVYFPFLSSGKKTYAGLKFEPKDVANAHADLQRPVKAIKQSGGSVEAKGIRTVRRDVPLFCRTMTEKLLDALFFERDMDLFWSCVHDFTERVCHQDIPLEAYTITKEIKDGYGSQVVVPPHVAVSYARERRVPGSGYAEGDRVCYVMVEEADALREQRPAWLDTGATPDVADQPAAFANESLNPKRCMYARHVDEVRADPANNHIDVEYYVDMGIISVLKQLMPDELVAQREILAYASAAKQYYRSVRVETRGLRMFLDDGHREVATREQIALRLPRLSHVRPLPRVSALPPVLALFGGVAEPVKKKKPAAKKKAPAVKPPSLAAFF
jgi:DNA polymerase elongation subunit (family B)